MVEKTEALEIVSASAWAAIILAPDGQIAEVVSLPGEPTAESFLEFTRTRVRGRRFRLIHGALTESQLDALIEDVMRPSEPIGRHSDGPRIPEWESSLSPFAAARCIADAIADFRTRGSN
jgi:hypothetical protein